MESIIDKLINDINAFEERFNFSQNQKELIKILNKELPEKLHRKIGKLCFKCLESPHISTEVKKLAKKRLFKLLKKYPRIAENNKKPT
ncbi:hypothetical protein [Bacteroidetes bacterium endosymbiont of Geopemphigus sp.]|uniref:hypothetical protein n=1 Tax=Bacteroidetes bacterium endosymbiont of Geopemphigus sp. TaxID=2047937 RepID=UPI000CD215F9|nr:hypothetical protein [Bacteroidetes bacterium endosymbiont of Geopemphigus sp.]